jgi:hypothetical protein
MRTSGPALMTAAAVLSAISLHGGLAVADPSQLAQVDLDMRMGPSRSPGVVIEDPRPPSAAIETEGRRERRHCRDVTITEWRDGIKVTWTEQQCDRGTYDPCGCKERDGICARRGSAARRLHPPAACLRRDQPARTSGLFCCMEGGR